MQRMHRLASLILVSMLLSACWFPRVYRIDIQQGNVIEQKMIDQLRPGMTKRQVQFVMGTPLVVDTFSPERWDYVYSIEPGMGEQRGERRQEQLSLFFEEDKLSHFTGHFRPSDNTPEGEGERETREVEASDLIEQTIEEDKQDTGLLIKF